MVSCTTSIGCVNIRGAGTEAEKGFSFGSASNIDFILSFLFSRFEGDRIGVQFSKAFSNPGRETFFFSGDLRPFFIGEALKIGGRGRVRSGVSSRIFRDVEASEKSRARFPPILGGGRGVAGNSRSAFFPRKEAGGFRTEAANSCS